MSIIQEEKKRIPVVTRKLFDEVYSMCRERFNPKWESLPKEGLTAEGYIEEIFKMTNEIIINIDEDCFITDHNLVEELAQYMINNGYDYCGMSDGGVLPIRQANPIVMNPFFNIFLGKKISDIYKLNKFSYFKKTITTQKARNIWEEYKDNVPLVSGVGYDPMDIRQEYYYPHFFWLISSGLKPLYLKAVDWDGDTSRNSRPTILLDHKGRELCIHSWFSRYWENEEDVKIRIKKCYDYCKNK